MSTPAIVILSIIAYFGLMMAVAWRASRGSTNSTFFTGGRKAPWPLVALATLGAAISGVTFISVPGMVVAKGYSYLQMILGFSVGYMVIAFVLVPMFYKRNLVSIYGYLEQRFGPSTYKSGAWMFFISKMLGAAVRFFVVCAVLQILVFDPLGIPFEFNVIVTIALIWLYTMQGGVKTVLWTDSIKSFCLVASVVMSIYFIASNLGFDASGTIDAIRAHHTNRIFYFDDPSSSLYFWKQFVAGVFMAIAMTGLDQDMMQRNLACANFRHSQKNMIVSSIVQMFVISLFLLLGTMLVIFMERNSIELPQKSDELFGLVATHASMPAIVSIVFVIGLVSAAYSAAGSALTSLTTSFTIDILGISSDTASDAALTRTRKAVHIAMSAAMGLVIIAFYYISQQDAISAVYTLASYTYGPILGLFAYGMIAKKPVRDRFVPAICVLAPAISWCLQYYLREAHAYETGFELLLINALLTMLGLSLLSLQPRLQES